VVTANRPADDSIAARLQALEDVEAVRVLMARYHDACDGWDGSGTHKDPAAIAALFTEDGVWAVTAREPAPRGPEEIASLARDLQIIPWIIHFVANPNVQVDGDRAAGRFKGIIRVRLKESAPMVWSIGIYHLVARRGPAGWLIESLDWEPATDKGRYDPSRNTPDH
jgi:ketosteroid isomerase-like protein